MNNTINKQALLEWLSTERRGIARIQETASPKVFEQFAGMDMMANKLEHDISIGTFDSQPSDNTEELLGIAIKTLERIAKSKTGLASNLKNTAGIALSEIKKLKNP